MNKAQVNSLVLSYREGESHALSEIFRQVNPLIEKASAQIESKVDDVTKFDCRVVLKIKQALEDSQVKDFSGYVKTIIGNERSDFLNRRKRKREDVSMNAMESNADDELGYQFEDPAADVEKAVSYKEKVALLAQGDDKKELVLTQWSRGAEDKAISELLAQRYGGKAESHRKFIGRFKTQCRNRLASEATV